MGNHQIRAIRRLIEHKDADGAAKAMPETFSVVDRAAKWGIIKKNTAARYKSRLTLRATSPLQFIVVEINGFTWTDCKALFDHGEMIKLNWFSGSLCDKTSGGGSLTLKLKHRQPCCCIAKSA